LAASKLLVAVGLAASNNEAGRLVQGGGVTVSPERTKLTDGNAALEVVAGLILRVGSGKIVRVRVV
jgi:tyrosyl-tRNA synthetase